MQLLIDLVGHLHEFNHKILVQTKELVELAISMVQYMVLKLK